LIFGNDISRLKAYINKKARKKIRMGLKLNEIVGRSIYNLKLGTIGSSHGNRNPQAGNLRK
jgi:hypothetical protein